MFLAVYYRQLFVSTQEAEQLVTSAACNGDVEVNQGEHVRTLLPVQSFSLIDLVWQWMLLVAN